MQQVTFLRMQRAAELLSTNNDKIEVIAASVGYQNPFVFSTTFKKWIGWRPSEFRAKQNASAKRKEKQSISISFPFWSHRSQGCFIAPTELHFRHVLEFDPTRPGPLGVTVQIFQRECLAV